ncbi:hypothetical protein PE067_03215 [Paracoccus sp. DMF-8]|uniref:hypothetical protein n=1 Tax=Paracoccus sp. DMF-8 TaxID=3019445 RepID=UPI0023E8F0BC|nr:hypothetical protein [Paracoccus sp. DMF-8]MDF3605254.1 hypothetical protein [Paracoccus sp. DMF-8]
MLATLPLHAAPADYQDALPADVLGMTPREAKLDGDRLIVFYGETVGRATVTIAPAPDADPKGENDSADAPEGHDLCGAGGADAAAWPEPVARDQCPGRRLCHRPGPDRRS